MKNRNIGIAITVAVVVVALGIYWSQNTTSQKNTQRQTQKPTQNEKSNVPEKVWDVSSKSTVQIEESTDSQQKKQTSAYENFTIPGRIIFPENINPRPVGLRVSVHPVKEERAKMVRSNNGPATLKELFKGGPDEALRTEKLTRRVTSNEDGKYKIENAVPGIYSIELADTEWSLKESPSKIQISNRVQPMNLHVLKNAKLKGQVVNADGVPLEATISFTDGTAEYKTDRNGNFIIPNMEAGEPIDYLRIYHDNYRSHFVSLPAPEQGETVRETFELNKAAVLRVKVRDQNDDPVTEGKLILHRQDDKEISFGAEQSIPHGEGKIVNVNEKGVGVFDTLQPGIVRVGHTFTNYLSKNKTVQVERDEAKTTVFRAFKGTPLNLSFINEQNGEPAQDIEPAVRVYNSEGEELEPGIEYKDQKSSGEFRAAVHPDASNLKIKVVSPNRTFQSKTESFNSSDFPDLKMQLIPQPKTGRPGQSLPPGLVKLSVHSNGSPINENNFSQFELYVMDAQSGEIIIRREGQNSVYNERIPLENGKYLTYGLLKRKTGQNKIVSEKIEIESQNPGSRKLESSSPGSITGTVTFQNNDFSMDTIKASLTFFEENSSGDSSQEKKIEQLNALTSNINKNGTFRINNVPPNTQMHLHLIAKEGSSLPISSGSIIESQSISSINPGENKSLPEILLNFD